MNAGFWARIAEDTPGPVLSKVLVAWVRDNDSRKISLKQSDNNIFHIEGMCAEEVEKILPLCQNIMATDKLKPDKKSGEP